MNISLLSKNVATFFLTLFLSASAYYLANGFYNIWFLMWLAPIPLCIYALNAPFLAAFFAGFLSYFIGGMADVVVYLHTKLSIMPFILGALNRAVAYACFLMIFRYVVMKYKSWSAVFIFAFGWISYEFILSLCSVHGTSGSIAYTQLPNLPVIQIASIIGIWGISFLLIFLPVSAAFLWHFRQDKKLFLQVGIAVLVFLMFILGFSVYKMNSYTKEIKIKVGMAALRLNRNESDAVFSNKDKRLVDKVIKHYLQNIDLLAKQSAQIVLLPEEILYLRGNNVKKTLKQFSLRARKNRVYLIAGFNIREQNKVYNSAFVFLPDGKMVLRYDKQHLLPFAEEANYTAGNHLGILQGTDVGKLGVAICKDMDFIYPAIGYSQQGVGVLLVPAWDFGFDAWIHGRMAIMRGVEGNFPVVRAAQDGLLLVSDSTGRIIAKRVVEGSPDKALLLAEVHLGFGYSLYSYLGDWFVWVGMLFLIICGMFFFAFSEKGRGILQIKPHV